MELAKGLTSNMKNHEITKKNLASIQNIVSDLGNMTEDEYNKFINSMVRFHDYSLSNQIILYANNCSQVAGYQKWLKLNRKVKKGAKAIWILAPRLKKNETTEEQEILGFMSVPVYDITDTEGEKFEFLTTASEIKIEHIEEILKKKNFTIIRKPLKIAKRGTVDISNKVITLNSNVSENENIGTLIHEFAHIELKHNEREISKRQREIEAETVTAIVCRTLGIDRNSKFYLKAWKVNENPLNDLKLINLTSRKIIKELRDFSEN